MKMKWALNELNNYQDDPLQINGTVDLSQSLKKRDKEIISVDPIEINGVVEVDKSSVYYVTVMVSTRLTLPSTRSLEPVDISLTFSFSEIYLGAHSSVSESEFGPNEIVERLTEDILDLRKPIEDAILTNKPTQVFTDEERTSEKLPSGKNWKVLTEDKHSEANFTSSEEEGDPRMAVLKDLFPDNNTND